MELVLANSEEVVVVDDDIGPALRRYWWKLNKQGYAYTYLGHIVSLQRMIMREELERRQRGGKRFVVDHLDGNKLDCRRANMRVVRGGVNILNNFNPSRKNTSGVVGVYWDERVQRWKATCGRKYLGSYLTPEEAVEARRIAVEAAGGRLSGRLKNRRPAGVVVELDTNEAERSGLKTEQGTERATGSQERSMGDGVSAICDSGPEPGGTGERTGSTGEEGRVAEWLARKRRERGVEVELKL